MLRWLTGNIWTYYAKGGDIVIPTNAGWTKNGWNVMGRGLAADAAKEADSYSPGWLSEFYGACCQLGMPRVYIRPLGMILVPSKPLNRDAPHLSWRETANPTTVRESLAWLEAHAAVFASPVYVPLLGAGNGRLPEEAVVAAMERILLNRKFTGVRPIKTRR